MRRPAQNKSNNKQQVARLYSIPAPIGGLNLFDPLANMSETDALVLDNWYPQLGTCKIRSGSIDYATDMTGTGKTLAVYNAADGTSKMFCSTESGIYNVSSAGAVGASGLARTSGKHRWAMFGDGTTNWLIMCNGVDAPAYYNGTTWLAVTGATSPALTVIPATTSLKTPIVFKGRLMFLAVNSLAFWYLPAAVAGGALASFDLSGIAQKGGHLVHALSWTVDSGTGPDDRMVFITSQGEVIVYQGTNPASSTAWALVGVFNIPRPIGHNSAKKVGSDVYIITIRGIYALSEILVDQTVNDIKNFTKKINPLFTSYANSYGSVYGWKITALHNKASIIVNIPVAEDGIHYQFVMNSITGAWSRFTGWDAEDFAVFNNDLYYCQSSKVVHAWTGNTDNGGAITAEAQTAYSDMGLKGLLKLVKMYKQTFSITGDITSITNLNFDYDSNYITGTSAVPSSANTASLWDTGVWDVSKWAVSSYQKAMWNTPPVRMAYAISASLKISTKVSVSWISNDYLIEQGGIF